MNLRFEYGVILNGSQTDEFTIYSGVIVIIKPHYRLKFLLGGQKYLNLRFEYGVILNGSQTSKNYDILKDEFEYGVILNGSQTFT